MEDTVALVASVVYGAIGAGYVVYGGKSGNPIVLAMGLSLWAFCAAIFFATWIFLGLGIVALFLPFVWRID